MKMQVGNPMKLNLEEIVNIFARQNPRRMVLDLKIQGDIFVEVDTCSYEATSLWWEMIPTSMRGFTPPGAKLILLFALLGAALATPLEAEENSLTADDLIKMEDDDSELELQQYKAELMPAYAISAEEHAEPLQFHHEGMKMGLLCSQCKTTAGYLIEITKSDKTKVGAWKKLSAKCKSLSFFLKMACNYNVSHYFDRLWNYLKGHQNANADSLCQGIKAC
eukprot:Em0009g802a